LKDRELRESTKETKTKLIRILRKRVGGLGILTKSVSTSGDLAGTDAGRTMHHMPIEIGTGGKALTTSLSE